MTGDAGRPSGLSRRSLAAWVVVGFALSLGPRAAVAQIPQLPQPRQPSPEDTIRVEPFRVRPPVSPAGAMLRSLLLPGWGQSILQRRVTGAVFVVWEGITMGMTLKASYQLTHMERTNDEAVDAKRQEVQDWAVLWVFNHLLAGAEAFVAANLWDFPDELQIRAMPGEGIGVSAHLRLP